ncbi:MAG: hypothetical protein IKU24_05110, partial [Clostridia bacterium]|nr:hypothetical protein [Clostridia bacterium]
MASIYRFKRNGKQDAEKGGSEKQTNDFFPRLFEENTAASQEGASDEKENTAIFTPADQKEVPQDLIDALTIPKVDSEKIDEIFNQVRSSSAELGEEQDKTSNILKEIFGSSLGLGNDKKEPDSSQDDYVAVHDSEEDKTRDYIAIHDGDEESTKEYHTAVSLGEILPEGETELSQETRAVPPLAEEVHVSAEDVASDPYSDTYEEIERKVERKPILPEEYTSPEEYDEFAEHLRNKNFRNLCSCLWTFFAFLVMLYLESACFSNVFHPEFLSPGGMYNAIYLLIDIQLVFISALLIFPSLGNGIGELFHGKPNRNTIAFFMHLFPALHAIILLIFGAKDYPLFGCVAGLFGFLTAVANFL